MDPKIVYLLGIPLVIWSLPFLFLAVFYAFVWPKKLAEGRPFSPWALRIIRWGNSLSWLCLALALISWGLGDLPLAYLLAILGGVFYLLFVVVVSGRNQRRIK